MLSVLLPRAAPPAASAAAGRAQSSADELDEQIRNVLKDDVTLMPLQREAVEFMVKNPRCIFADDPGLGKTIGALTTLGVLAQRAGEGRFRVLIGLYNKGFIDTWVKELNKFTRPGFFTTQVLTKNDEPLVKADRLIVFTTYARMRNTFADALELLPDDCIPLATKRRQSTSKRPRATPNNEEPIEEVDDDDDAERQSLLDALLAEHGLCQVDGEAAGAPASGGSGQGGKRSKKRGASGKCLNAVRFEEHRLDTLEHRRALFSAHRYWEKRVNTTNWLPCAPLLGSGPPMYTTSWDVVLFDEAHELKDIRASQTKAALFLHYTTGMLWQSGTPIQNKLLEIVSALLMIRDDPFCCELGPVYSSDGTELKGNEAHETRALRSLQRIAFRRSTADLLRNKRDVIASDSRTSYMVNTRIRRHLISKFWMSEEEKELHNKYVQRLRNVAERLILSNKAKKTGLLGGALKRSAPAQQPQHRGTADADAADDDRDGLEVAGGEDDTLIESYTRALQVCAAAEVIEDADNPIPPVPAFGTESTKMRMLMEVLTKHVPRGEKVIIFDRRVKVLRVVSRLLLQHKIVSVLFAGGIPEGAREANLALWKQPNSGTDILLASTKLAGVNFTLTEAHVVIHLTVEFNPAVEDQANYRAWRIGQTADVDVFVLYVAGSVEELAEEIQRRKRADNTAYLSGAEVATKSKERIRINPEDVLRHADAILGMAQGGFDTHRGGTGLRVAAYRERNTLEEESQLDHLRKLYHGPAWVTEELMSAGKVFFLDPARSYSEASFLPRGSVLMCVASSAHVHARELSHCAERQRLRREAMSPSGAAALVGGKRGAKKTKTASGDAARTAAVDEGPRGMRVALCSTSLYVLLRDEFYGELDCLGKQYLEKRNAQVRVVGRAGPALYHRPLSAVHSDQFFPSNTPPVASARAVMDPDHRGDAYNALTKLMGNAALRQRAAYNLENLNTPAEIYAALKEYFPPQFGLLRSVDKHLQRSKHLDDTYHYRTQPNGLIELKGSVAALLTDHARSDGVRTFNTFQLDVDVLLSFAPLWHQGGLKLAERLAKPAVPRKGATDLYAMENEAKRKALHWVNSDGFGSEPLAQEVHLINRGDFAPITLRDVLLPLVYEAGTPGCSAHVRAMATAVLCVYALAGCELTKVYLLACGDKDRHGAGAIQGLFVAIRVNRDTLVAPAIYLRSPSDGCTREVFSGAVVGRLLRDQQITTLVNAQERIAPMEYDRAWCRTPRPQGQPATYNNGCPSTIAWGHYADGYATYYREACSQEASAL